MSDNNYDNFCKELTGLDDAIVAALVLSNGIKGSHIKLNVPVLKDEDAQRLSEQTVTIMEIVQSNERLFGQLGFVLVRHEAVDGMFFPADNLTTVLVGLLKPYDPDKIERTVMKKIRSDLKKRSVDSI